MNHLICKDKRSNGTACLYCRWIVVQGSTRKRLAAVWIDPQMRAFEKRIAQCEDHAVGLKEVGTAAAEEQPPSKIVGSCLSERRELTLRAN